MTNPYDMIFATLYLWGLKQYGEEDGPQYSAVLGLSLVALINVVSVAHVLYGLGFHQLQLSSVRKEWFLVLGVVIAFLHYQWFLRRDRFRKLAQRFEKASGSTRGVGELITILYAAASIALLFAAWSF